MRNLLLIWLLLSVGGILLAAAPNVSERARRIHRAAIVIDTHIDAPLRMMQEGFDLTKPDGEGHVDLPRMKQGGLDAAFFAIWADPVKYKTGAVEHSLKEIDLVYEQVRRDPKEFVLARSPADIRRAHRAGQRAILMGLEGGHAIENSLEILRNYDRLGVRYMTLTHTKNTDWADSSNDEPAHNGLTEFGKEVVREMNRLGMIVDISHVSDKTFYDVLAVTRVPVMASHSSCRALSSAKRNMTDDMIRALAHNGGVIQISFGCFFVDENYNLAVQPRWDELRKREEEIEEHFKDHPRQAAQEIRKYRREMGKQLPVVSIERVVDHIDHAVKIAGIDHVGLGSDFDGVGCLPEGLRSVADLPNLTEALLRRGYSERDIRKILGGNTLRVMEMVERAAGH